MSYPGAEQESDAESQYLLGWWYYVGKIVGRLNYPQDYSEALKWFRKAAEQNHAESQNYIGDIYAMGQGVAEDYTQLSITPN